MDANEAVYAYSGLAWIRFPVAASPALPRFTVAISEPIFPPAPEYRFIENASLAEAAFACVKPPHQLNWLMLAPLLSVNSAAACVADEFDTSAYQIVV